MVGVHGHNQTTAAGDRLTAPLTMRHPWLGTDALTEGSASYFYAVWPIRSWAGTPSVDATVRCSSPCVWPSGQKGWTLSHDRTGFVARCTIAAHDVSTSMLTFDLVTEPGTTTHALHGGPLVGLGGRIVDASRLRARIGYEAAFPWWVIWSAAAETDFRDTATIIPLLGEVASPGALFVPSLGIGAGIPVQFRSGAGVQAGARLQGTVSFPVLSLVIPVDVYPGAASAYVWQLGLFGQASF